MLPGMKDLFAYISAFMLQRASFALYDLRRRVSVYATCEWMLTSTIGRWTEVTIWITPEKTVLYRDFLPDDSSPHFKRHHLNGGLARRSCMSMIQELLLRH